MVLLAACAEPRSVQCGDIVCPADNVCHDVHGCLLVEQTKTCVGKPDGERCTADIVEGICDAELCVPGCGDGTQAGVEECDDGNFLSHDGCSSACAFEAPGWTAWKEPFRERRGHVAEYHAATSTLVVTAGFGVTDSVADQWSRDASGTWTQAVPAIPSRNYAASAYDSGRGRIVVFGGSTIGNASKLDETWEYDGATWRRIMIPGPPARFGAAMAYDPLRQRVVLFGGYDPLSSSPYFGDTWEYDGTAWTKIDIAAPSARYFHTMTWHPGRGAVVLFGGFPAAGVANEQHFWEYDGAWSEMPSVGATPPPRRYAHSAAYHPAKQRLVVFGGAQYNVAHSSDTWEWDAATGWSVIARANNPPGRQWATLTYAGSRLVLVGGSDAAGPMRDVWEYDNSKGYDPDNGWVEITPRNAPLQRVASPVYDESRREVVVPGGYTFAGAVNDVWTYKDGAWRRRLEHDAGRVPSPRIFNSSAYDSTRGVSVMFGGTSTAGDGLDDVSEWNGTSWVARVTANPPPARYEAGFVYDRAADVFVMFGGLTGGQPFGDTWELSGSAWTQVPTPSELLPHYAPSMAYDVAGARTVLLGSDGVTWTYANRTWSSLGPATMGRRDGAATAYDPRRQRVLLVGGIDDKGNRRSDAWELDGDTWREVLVGGELPSPRFSSALVADPPGRSMMLFGGQGSLGFPPDAIWFLRYGSQTPDEQCANGIDDDGDRQVDALDPDCAI